MLYLAIAFGGALGAVSRFWVSTQTYRWLGTEFPYGTLAVNVTGSFLMGFLTIALVEVMQVSQEIRYALLVGFLGSYTTFSTFALDAVQGFYSGNWLKMLVYLIASVCGSLLGVWSGLLAARFLAR